MINNPSLLTKIDSDSKLNNDVGAEKINLNLQSINFNSFDYGSKQELINHNHGIKNIMTIPESRNGHGS